MNADQSTDPSQSEGSRAEGEHRARACTRVYLLVFHDDSVRMVPLRDDGDAVIGRGEDNDVVIADRSVSRQHANLSVVEGLATISDLGSQNGTRVNGELISGTRALLSGDLITVGSVVASFHTSARRDPSRELFSLTGLQQQAASEIARSRRSNRSFSLAAIDLAIGRSVDRVAIMRTIAHRLRVLDAVAWSASDQLLIVQPETDTNGGRVAATALLGLLQNLAPSARAGVATYPQDGCDVDTLIWSARQASQSASAAHVASAVDMESTRVVGGHSVIVADPAMARVYALIERLAVTELTVLVCGETGTGKELAARALHGWSVRAKRPLVSLNCAAIAESLVERELFGHERGAFSGAINSQAGLLESADGGTVFLDEIGELSLAVQAKLLRVVETRRLTRIGDVDERAIDIRIIAATNRDLEEAVQTGAFRRDLYFRLSGAKIWLPPLRDRVREVSLLAHSFLSDACERQERDAPSLSSGALQSLASYGWPGNIRELKNVIEYLAATTSESTVEAEHVALRLGTTERPQELPEPELAAPKFRKLEHELRDLERKRIEEALAACDGNQTRAAELIGMPLRTFASKIRAYDLRRQRKQ